MIRQSGVPVVENGNLPRRPLDMVVSYSNLPKASIAMTLALGASGGYKKIAFASLFSANNDPISRPASRGISQRWSNWVRTPDPRLMIETSRGPSGGRWNSLRA